MLLLRCVCVVYVCCMYRVCVFCLFVVCCCLYEHKERWRNRFFVGVKKLFSRTSLFFFFSLPSFILCILLRVLCVVCECEFVCILYKYIVCVGLLWCVLLLL